MIHLKTFDAPKQFLDFNREKLSNQYFEHYHLHYLFDELKDGKGVLHDAYNIINDDGSNIIAVWVDDVYFVYGTKWNEEVLKLLEEKIDIDNHEINIFRGQKDLIIELLKQMKMKYEIINDRIIYSCDKVNKIQTREKSFFDTGRIDEFPVILQMCLDYYEEDFKGKGQQSKEAQTQSVYNGLLQHSIYTWNDEDEIVSVARIINADIDNVMIGGLFTRLDKRKKGYAYFLISELTNNLLQKEVKKCGLLTEASNPGSNRVFEKAGYIEIYNWINILTL